MAMPQMALDPVSAWLGTRVEPSRVGLRQVREGLPNSVVKHLLERGLSRQEVFSVVLPLRTYKHRKTRREPLSTEESERALRVARILAQAATILGDSPAALAWAREPKRRFDGEAPLALLATEPGGRLVEEFLVQIDEGMFA